MLRRYAAGSIFGSGAGGKVMSGSEGDENEEPVPLLARGGDLRELLDDLVPSDLVESPLGDTFPFFRLKKPMMDWPGGVIYLQVCWLPVCL